MNNPFFDFDLLAFPNKADHQFTIEGQGQGKILILAYIPQQDKNEDYAFLENVLKAVNLTPLEDKIHLLQSANDKINLSLSRLATKMDSKHILIFGLNLKNLGVRADIPKYQFLKLNKLNILLCDSIGLIREERAAKKNQKAAALWQALKTQFLS